MVSISPVILAVLQLIVFRLMLGFQLSTGFLSMWLSNTATTAMMVPIAMAVIIELHQFNALKTNNSLIMSMVFVDAEAADADQKESEEQEAEAEEGPQVEQLNNMLDPREVSEKELKIYKGFMLAICYSANIGGTGTLIGTGSNIVLSGQLTRSFNLFKDAIPIVSGFIKRRTRSRSPLGCCTPFHR